MHRSTSNSTAYVRLGANSTPFYGECSIVQSINFSSTAGFAIQQNSNTSYSFFFNTGVSPGVGFFTVQSQSVFTYSGTTSSPAGCYIYPTVLYQQGTSAGDSTLISDALQAYFFKSTDGTFRILNSSSTTLFTINASGSTLNTPLTCTGAFTCPDA